MHHIFNEINYGTMKWEEHFNSPKSSLMVMEPFLMILDSTSLRTNKDIFKSIYRSLQMYSNIELVWKEENIHSLPGCKLKAFCQRCCHRSSTHFLPFHFQHVICECTGLHSCERVCFNPNQKNVWFPKPKNDRGHNCIKVVTMLAYIYQQFLSENVMTSVNWILREY